MKFEITSHFSLFSILTHTMFLFLYKVFRNTMFGPEGRPQHCCAWLGIASSFPECASSIVPEEVKINPCQQFILVKY